MRVLAILILLVAAWSCNPKDKTKEAGADTPVQEDTIQQDAPQGDAVQEGTTQEGGVVATPDALSESGTPNPVMVMDSLEWTLFTIIENGNTTKLSSEDKMTATFQGGRVTGFGGCNAFNGAYSATSAGSMRVSNLASSKKYCEGMMKKETAFFKVLEGVNSWKMTGNRLELKGSAGELQFIHTKVRVIQN
ncbi:MAG: META domain-containing protein [Saprospiraceae bacterium]|nr:META domain-containing protein [Saprospiraceae bacterium]